ncbi:MAG: TonB-dependent receptor domain-containing protein [Panacagrimonas sp.]
MRDFFTSIWLPAACLAAVCVSVHAAVPSAGQVLVLVTQGGAGIRGLSVVLDGADIASTNSSGAATLTVGSGEHLLEVRRGALSLTRTPLALGAGDAAELLLRLPDGAGPPATELDVFASASAGTGVLEGYVTDETGEPVAGAQIRAADARTSANADGYFELKLPRGTWDVTVSHPQKKLVRVFEAQRVSPNLDAGVNLSLSERRAAPTGAGIEEVVATARYTPDTSTALERSSDTVLDAISEQEIAIAGDSDAAAALTRVTGVTIVNDLVFVRGLGDRYSATYVNRGEVPSPDPSRRAIGLNIFPTDILGGISVQKTYSPDLPGDFSGGAVLLSTRGIPEDFNVSLGVTSGGNTRSTSKDGLSYSGGDSDWLGRDDGFRAIPDIARGLTDNGRTPLSRLAPDDPQLNAQLVEQVGDSLRPVFDVKVEKMRPDLGLELAFGDRYDGWNFARLGYQVTLLYDAKTRFREEARISLSPQDRKVPLRFEDRERTEQGVDTGGIVTLAAEFDDENRLGYTGILSRQTTQGTFFSNLVTTAAASNNDINDHAFTLDWVENQLASHQLTGTHLLDFLGNLSIEWQATKASAESDTLDRREYRYRRSVGTEDPFQLVLAGANPRRSWEFLEDDTDDLGLGASLPLQLPWGIDAEVEAGVRRTDRARTFDKVSWAYQILGVPNDVQISLLAPSLEFVLDPRYIRPDAWRLINGVTQIPGASNADSYIASQDLSAFYLSSKFNFGSAVELEFGARKEDSNITVGLANVDEDAEPLGSELDDSDWLPALNLSWFLDDRHTIRAGYSRTVNRPQFREIAPITYRDPDTRDQSFGNPDLQQAELKNYDLRYEFSWNAAEGVTVAAFLKDIVKPIEVVVGSDSVGEAFVTFSNARSAEIYGIELDGRWELDEFDGVSEHIGYSYISGNVSLIESNVELEQAPDMCDPPVSVSERPLQGQSPWIANLTLGYSNPILETDAALLFNMFGKRSVRVGQLLGCAGLPDEEEQPAAQVDLNLRQRLFDSWKLGFKVRNLLDPKVEVEQGSFVTRSYRTGRSITLSVEYEF